MKRKYIFPLLTVILVCSGCAVNISNEGAVTATPDFVTATLPATAVPPSTQTPEQVISTPSVVETTVTVSVEGTTTTQLNVRAEPSTASETLGIISQFEMVQIIGRDASGSWYQIVYVDSKGWVRAEYVQVNAAAEIPVIGGVAGSGSGVSGLVIQKINIRSGPGLTFESLGTLNPKDVVFISGQDPSGKWLLIDYTNGTEGKGWAALEFLQVDDPAALPIIGDTEKASATPAPAGIAPAPQDGDSMQSPLATALFSTAGMNALQVSNSVSAPEGDAEDWLQFSSFSENVLVEINCSNNAFSVELWNNGQFLEDMTLVCAESLVIKLETGQPYLLRLQANGSDGFQIIQYDIKITAVR